MSLATRTLLATVCAVALPAVGYAQRAELAHARSLYNERQFSAAIDAATAARALPGIADTAAILLARAHLERYREQVDPFDLSAARAALSAVRASALDDRDQIEFLLALGESLFLEDDFGAAAEIFDAGLESAAEPALHDALLEWWASALDRQAASLSKEMRAAVFERLRTRMNAERARRPGSPTVSYWSVVALRGNGDTTRAWDAAVAAWVRARMMGDQTAAFRSDINRLVIEGIIPDRVRPLPPEQRELAEAQFKADWELVKEKWK
jgi:hypothetical protein